MNKKLFFFFFSDTTFFLSIKDRPSIDLGMAEQPAKRAPRLNERILSSLSKRSAAAHPWHDLDIGTYSFIFH